MNLRFWSAALAVILSILILVPAAMADEKTRSDTVWVQTFNQQLSLRHSRSPRKADSGARSSAT